MKLQGGISGVGQRPPHRYPGCYFARFSDEPCSGRMDPAHILPQRLLKRLHANANPRLPTAWHCPSALTGTTAVRGIIRRLKSAPARRQSPGAWHRRFGSHA